MSRKTIVLLSATGNLGKLIAQKLAADPNVHLRLPVRPDSRAKLGDIAGAEITDLDVATASPDQLKAAFDGAFCVVSTTGRGCACCACRRCPETIGC